MRFILIYILLLPFISFSQIDTNAVIKSDSILLERDTLEKTYFKISGIVFEYNTNTRLPFVNFFTKSNLGTISNNDGEIVFKYPKDLAGDSIYLSSIGYKNQDFILPNRDTKDLKWILELDTISLKEVIVNPKEAIEIISNALEKIPENYDVVPFVVENFFSNNEKSYFTVSSKKTSDVSFKSVKNQQASFIQRNKPQISKKEKDEILLNAFRSIGSPPEDQIIDFGLDFLLSYFEEEGDSIKWPDKKKGRMVYWKDPSINWRDSVRNQLIDFSNSTKGYSYYSTLKKDFVRNQKKHFLFSKKNLKKYDFDLVDIIKYNHRNTYVISFSRKKRSQDIMKNWIGNIYIDTKTSAFVALKSSIKHHEDDKYCNIGKMGKICMRLEDMSSFVSYKLFDDGKWGLNFISYTASYDSQISLNNLIVRAFLFTKLPRSIRRILPDIIKTKTINTSQIVVFDKIDDTSHLNFDTNHLILPKTTIKETQDSEEDIWGKYNYLKTPQIPD